VSGPAPAAKPGLGWGWRYLMCPPDFFGVYYEINPWMHTEVKVDPERARTQWEGLVATLTGAGAEVELLEPAPGLPDLVFTANAGIVNGRQFVAARFRHPQRQGESARDIAWFSAHGYRVDELSPGAHHEGAGDALPFGAPSGAVLVSGYRFRSDAASHAEISRLTGAAVRSVELVDPRLYHLDLTFCPLDDRRAMVAPLGWDRYGLRVLDSLVPEPLFLEDDEALSFCANSVVVGPTVVMPACPPRIGRALEAWGFEPVECNVSELLKAGGGCRCLTLALDVELGKTRQ
jgi:N-dimethylarginine dimethylaminohydrolase